MEHKWNPDEPEYCSCGCNAYEPCCKTECRHCIYGTDENGNIFVKPKFLKLWLDGQK